jgi:hypothetical protein
VLQMWEAQRSANVSPQEHERNWSEEPTLRRELEALRDDLGAYAEALANIVGVKTE